MAFTPNNYIDLVQTIIGRGYAIVDFATADPKRKHLLLRHDIDMSIQAAVEMAEAEAAAGLKSTYFVLMRSEFYNPWAPESWSGLRRISGLGHDVGLHLDAALYRDVDEALEVAALRECSQLEGLLEQPVTSISFHRPAKRLLGREGRLAGRQHAYQPRFFSDMGYCSDSRGGWHQGPPLEHPALNDGRALQLLTHPIWWTGGDAPPANRLSRFVTTRQSVLDRELAKHCSIYVANDSAGATDE